MEAELITFLVIGVAMVLLSVRCCWAVRNIWNPPPPSSAAVGQELLDEPRLSTGRVLTMDKRSDGNVPRRERSVACVS